MSQSPTFSQPFLPQDFEVTDWAVVQPFYDQLLAREISSMDAFRQWLADRDKLEGVLNEDAGWRYIHMTCATTNAAYKARYTNYIEEITPKLAPLTQALNQKALECPYAAALRQESQFDIMFRCMESSVQLYRSESIAIFTQIQLNASKYNEIMGAMTITLKDQLLTLQQASVHLASTDRALRETVYRQVNERRLQDQDTLDGLYTSLVQDRQQIATNAGFDNFRDYMFVSLNRFDYTPQDCFSFHNAVAQEIVPLLNDLAQERQQCLGVDKLKPWDKVVDPTGQPPLKPFVDTQDLLQKTITLFDRLDPKLGDCLRTMQTKKHFDLASRPGKAPGGYNYPLHETGIPFIFMNATSTLRDMVTLIHEGGHAVHSFQTQSLPLHAFKQTPSEVSELASMSMELLTMDHWDIFFPNKEDRQRAQKQHLVQVIETLAWVATIDQFQHWIYENPAQTPAQRKAAWNETFDRFADNMTNWDGQTHYKDTLWQKQLHLFEVPFYYIEYGIAQLGAIAVWKHYQENPAQGLRDYLKALRLGYTYPVPQVYKAAGISFDFSQDYIHELIQFVRSHIATL